MTALLLSSRGSCAGARVAHLARSGAARAHRAYCGLWTAVLAKRRDSGARVVLLEARTVGWAASGRNGGFCEASLTHGEDNGRRRWPTEYDRLEALGDENLDAIERAVTELGLDCEFERTASIGIQATRWSLDRADHNRGRRNLILKTLDELGLGFDS